MGNVTSVQTTLTTGTDNQAFCYDEQNRLTWASAATGTPPCGGSLTGVTRTYLASDGLGSESVDLSYNGSVLATALYGPYGVGLYATGTMPSSKGYTGQRQDSGSGLDYYNARYYDPTLGQFTSADTVQGPNRFGYVGGNPETATDPTGQMTVGTDGVGGDIIVYQEPSPRPNTRAAYEAHFWSDSGDGSGTFNDYKDKTWMFKPPTQWSHETRDGLLLSWYFGVHVSHVMEGKVQGRSYPDYNIYAAGYEGYGLVPFIPNVRFKTFKDTVTVAEEYTPDKGTDWGDPASGKKGGILYQAYKKGGQASILVIDLRNIDPNGTLTPQQLNGYAAQIVYWPQSAGGEAQKPSQVARVIFVNNFSVVDDFDPRGYGPMRADQYGPHPPLLA